MHRIDVSTATEDNKFTEGDPVTGVEATDVSDDWLNDVQENLCKFIENAGFALAKGNYDQLTNAISAFSEESTSTVVINNNVTDINIPSLAFLPANFKSIVLEYDVYRKDDSKEVVGGGKIAFRWKPSAQQWVKLGPEELNEADTGFSFGFTQSVDPETENQIQINYSANEFEGANYAGFLKYKLIKFKA